MYTRKILICLLLITYAEVSAQNWELQNSGTKATLRSISFVDSLHGYVVGDSSTMLKTTNGGKNWLKLSMPKQSVIFRKVQFISKTVGFVVSSDGSLLSTTDSGLNWSVDIIMPDSSGFFHDDLCFINENEGWMTGRKEGKNYGIGIIMHTTNGGKTWTKQLELKSYIQTDVKYFTSIKFINRETGWALASDYFDNFSSTFLYRTDNGGINWNIVNVIKSIPVNDIKLINRDTLWIGGGSSAKFVKTFNGGTTLNYSFIDTIYASQIAPQSGLQGWLSHRKPFNFSDYNKIMFTMDGGITWKEEYRIKETVLGMCTLNNYLWLVGTDGLILKRTPLKTSVKETQEIYSKQKIQLQNYPNPFNSTTQVNYQLPLSGFVTLKIYDLLGREVTTLVNETQPAGYYTIRFNGSSLPSGIYVYQLTSNNINISKKMILMK